MRERERKRFLRLHFTEAELEVRDRLYKSRKLAKYKIIITQEKRVGYGIYENKYGERVSLGDLGDFPNEGIYVDTIYFYRPDQFKDIVGLYEGLFYELYEIESGKRIGFGMLDPDSPVEEIRETVTECCCVCELCFWHGMLYNEEKDGNEYKCYMNKTN